MRHIMIKIRSAFKKMTDKIIIIVKNNISFFTVLNPFLFLCSSIIYFIMIYKHLEYYFWFLILFQFQNLLLSVLKELPEYSSNRVLPNKVRLFVYVIGVILYITAMIILVLRYIC
jgi:hypothetical protein